MKRLIVMAMVLGGLAGCNLKSVPEATKEAYDRWHETRARILYGVALQHFKVGQLDKARVKASEALALDEDFIEGRVLLAKIYIEQGEYSLAIRGLTRVNKDVPESAEVLYLLGVAQEKAGRLDEALTSYRRSQALDVSGSEAVKAAAEVLAAQGRTHDAQVYIETYLSPGCNDPGLYELAGRLAVMRKDYSRAASYYREALDLDYKNTRYAESLVKAQFFARQYPEAMEGLNGLAQSPDYEPGGWVFTMLGDCYMAMGRSFHARDAYQRATEISPSNSGVWSNLAKAALAMKDLPRAIVSARHAHMLDSACLEATILLGYALLRDGQVSPSLDVLKQGAARHPDSPELRCVLGRAHAAGGNKAEAMRCYAAALRIDPANALARELLDGGSAPRKLSIVE